MKKVLISLVVLVLLSSAAFSAGTDPGRYCREKDGECLYLEESRWCETSEVFSSYAACIAGKATNAIDVLPNAVGTYCRELDAGCIYMKYAYQVCDSNEFYRTYTGCKKGTGKVIITSVEKPKVEEPEPVVEEPEPVAEPEPEPVIVEKPKTGRNRLVVEDEDAKNTGYIGTYCKELDGTCLYMKSYATHCDSNVLYWDYQSCKKG